MKKITAEDIAKRLPMKVKHLGMIGMFRGCTINFTTVIDEKNKDWVLQGVDDFGRFYHTTFKNAEFGWIGSSDE